MGEHRSALDVFERAVEEEPENPSNWLAYGNLPLECDRGKKAVEALRKALELDPDAPAIRFYLGCALTRTGNHDEAARHFRSIIGDDPDLEHPLSALGLSALMCVAECQGALGDWKEATETVKPAGEKLMSMDTQEQFRSDACSYSRQATPWARHSSSSRRGA